MEAVARDRDITLGVYSVERIKEIMQEQGYRHYLSMAGKHRLDDFDPYGLIRDGSDHAWQGRIIGPGRVRDYTPNEDQIKGFAAGVWEFTR